MDEDQSDLLSNIFDEQERFHLQLNSIKNLKKIDSHKVLEIKFLHLLFCFLIVLGFIILLIMIILNMHFIMILIDAIFTFVYITYFNYIKYKYKKIFKLSKNQYKQIIKTRKKIKEISLFQYILYSFIIIGTISVLIFSVINLDFGILIFILCISLIYIYLDNKE